MRILFLTSRFPFPPTRGDRTRTYHFLRALGTEHELTLVTFIGSPAEHVLLREVAPYCTAVHVVPWPAYRSVITTAANLWRPRPLQVLYYQSRAMRQLVDRLVATENFDAAYAHLFRMAPYLADHGGLYRIVDFTDLISQEIRAALPYQPAPWRAIYQIELPRMVGYEDEVASWADEVWFISERDRAAFAGKLHHAALPVIPNLLDEGLLNVPQAVGGDGVLFVGNLDVRHNLDAVRLLIAEVMPLVWRSVPDVRLRIAGAGNTTAVRAFSHDTRIEVMGYVPDLVALYGRSAVFAAALRFAAGTQNKVVEAMACGLPVVASTPVAEGLDADKRRVVAVADNPREVATQIVTLLTSPIQARTLGQAGQRFIRDRYRRATVLDHMRALEGRLRS